MTYSRHMAKTFREALLETVERTGKSLKAIADGANVSYEQLKKVSQREGASTNVDDARRVANFLGITLDEFLEDHTAQDRVDAAKLYSQLTPAEREILQATARGLRVRDREEAP
jgi:transcriptional regulator with XRE-family HTH domain